MPKFIAISGKARAGKDTFAGYLKDSLEAGGARVLVTHYADLLKYICKTFFGWNGEKDDAGRTLLQFVGTERVRAVKPDFWVDFILDIVAVFGDMWDYVVIPDVRFPNELNKLAYAGYEGKHIRITRPDYESPLTAEQQHHISETGLDGVECDLEIINTTLGGMQADAAAVARILLEGGSS